MIKTILLIDGNNIFHKNYHSNKKTSDTDLAIELSAASSLFEFKFYFDKFKPVLTAIAFDSKGNWRKQYTKSEKAVTRKVYKSNRSENKTKQELEAKKKLNETISETADMLEKYTKLVVLREELLEADDLIAGMCHLFGNSEYDIKLLSTDKDYMQLLRYDNVEIVNPKAGGKVRTLADWNNDAELFMFEKCIRGDGKDNVRSAYPRVRSTKILEAFYDDVKRSNLLNHTFTEVEYDEATDSYPEREYEVNALFEENQLLLDLNKQPENIKTLINDVIENELSRKKVANFVKFLQYASAKEFNNIVDRGGSFLPFIQNKPKKGRSV